MKVFPAPDRVLEDFLLVATFRKDVVKVKPLACGVSNEGQIS